jgi:erythromycin esterase
VEKTIDSPRPDTVDATLDDLGCSRCVLDLRATSEDPRTEEWLSRPRNHVSVGAVYEPENPEKYVTEYAYADAFDAVCYVGDTTRARPVK